MEQKDGVQRILKLMTVAQETCENAKECLNINYYGVKRVTEALIPLLQLADSPRVVNVSSLYGQLRVGNLFLNFMFRWLLQLQSTSNDTDLNLFEPVILSLYFYLTNSYERGHSDKIHAHFMKARSIRT